MQIEIHAAYILIFNILMSVSTFFDVLKRVFCVFESHAYFVVAKILYRSLKQALPMISHCWPGVRAETIVLGPTHPVFLTRRCMRAGSMG